MTLSEGNGPMIMSHAADLLPGLHIGEVNFGDDHMTLKLVASNDDRARSTMPRKKPGRRKPKYAETPISKGVR